MEKITIDENKNIINIEQCNKSEAADVLVLFIDYNNPNDRDLWRKKCIFLSI
jgi:hypothetical protein